MEIDLLWTFKKKMVPIILVVDVKGCTIHPIKLYFGGKYICHSIEASQISQMPTWTGCVASLKTMDKTVEGEIKNKPDYIKYAFHLQQR